MNRTRLGFLFSFGFTLLLSGCQGTETSSALPYEGEVKINGKPISGAMVGFAFRHHRWNWEIPIDQ